MSQNLNPSAIHTRIEEIYHNESRRVLATLIRLLGDFDLAEDALHEAFRAAVEQWPTASIPANPRAWLVSTGRFKGIDALRRRARFEERMAELAAQIDANTRDFAADIHSQPDEMLEDDRLRLIFTCCHPVLTADARVALTLREVCGLTTEAIAHAYLINPSTLAQRIVRAKARLADARIPYQVPEPEELPARLETVLQVIYLVFNEGYTASSGDALTRPDLSAEAIRLGRLLVVLLPEPEAVGLLALMLLHESRRAARMSADGELIVLEEQERTLWDRALIEEGSTLAERAWLAHPEKGRYTIQAALAALHAAAPTVAATDWRQIVGLYDLLLQAMPSPIVALNRAVAVAMRDGAHVGLPLIDDILMRGDVANYHLAHAARADLLRRMGRTDEAAAAYRRALELAQQEAERRFLTRRLRELES